MSVIISNGRVALAAGLAGLALLAAPVAARAQVTHLVCEMVGSYSANRWTSNITIDLARREVTEDGKLHTVAGTVETNASSGVSWQRFFLSATETDIVWKTSTYQQGVLSDADFYVARLNRLSGTISTSWSTGECRRIEAKDRLL